MTAVNQDVRLTAGDTHTVRVVCRLPGGGPIDLTGGAGYMTVARTINPGATIVLRKIGTVDTVVENGQNYSRANFVLAPADTIGLEPREYMHQCEVRMSGGIVYTVAEGVFEVRASMPPEL